MISNLSILLKKMTMVIIWKLGNSGKLAETRGRWWLSWLSSIVLHPNFNIFQILINIKYFMSINQAFSISGKPGLPPNPSLALGWTSRQRWSIWWTILVTMLSSNSLLLHGFNIDRIFFGLITGKPLADLGSTYHPCIGITGWISMKKNRCQILISA